MTHIDALPATLHRLQPLRVLVVGRDRRFLRVTSFLLARKGYEIAQAAPLEAVVAAERHRADVVVLEAGSSRASAARSVAALGALAAAPGVLIVTEEKEDVSWAGWQTVPKWTSLGTLVDHIETASVTRPLPIVVDQPLPAVSAIATVPDSAEESTSRQAAFVTAAVAAVLSVLAVLRYGADGDTVVAVFLVVVLVLVSRTDFERRVIPNRIVIPSWLAVLAVNTALHPQRWAEWLLASFGAALVFFFLARAYRGGLGMGDVKLVLLLGAALGSQVVPALMIGTGAAAVLSLLILLRHGLSARKQTIPLGPFLAAGALVDLLLL
jgi:Flp pilus assembly protein protease CpaA/CheY-like chemotaxis protein